MTRITHHKPPVKRHTSHVTNCRVSDACMSEKGWLVSTASADDNPAQHCVILNYATQVTRNLPVLQSTHPLLCLAYNMPQFSSTTANYNQNRGKNSKNSTSPKVMWHLSTMLGRIDARSSRRGQRLHASQLEWKTGKTGFNEWMWHETNDNLEKNSIMSVKFSGRATRGTCVDKAARAWSHVNKLKFCICV